MERIDPARLARLLPGEPFATRIVALDEITSTNDEAQRLAAEGAPQGTVVLAESQSAGRGRLARAWHSPPGLGLYVSVLFRPREPLELWTRFGILAALAACDACRELGRLPVALKWPNDLFVARRKLGGVLAELRTTGGAASALVVGVGINVGHAEGDFPPELRERATSLRIASGGSTPERTLLLASYLRNLGRFSDMLAGEGWPRLVAEWSARAPDAEGRRVRVLADPAFEGKTRGLDASGALRIERASGLIVALRSGESLVVLEE